MYLLSLLDLKGKLPVISPYNVSFTENGRPKTL